MAGELLVFCAVIAAGFVSADSLKEGFQSPPDEVRPRVWWHWLNGAISEKGLEKDLAWMNRGGVSGVQIFSGSMPNNEAVLEKPVRYMSPEWKRLFRGAVERASEYNMEVTVPTSAGWSETGAPFVDARDGMKKLVWSELEIDGGQTFRGKLPVPPDTSGPFLTIPIDNKNMLGQRIEVPRYYADSRVIAYRLPDRENEPATPIVSTLKGTVNAVGLMDGRLEKALSLPYPSHDKPVWIQFDYPGVVTLRSLTAVLEPKKPHIIFSGQIQARLEVKSADGTYRKAVDLTIGAFTQNTNAFNPVEGKSFRVVFQPDPPSATPMTGLDMAPGALLQPGLEFPMPPESLTISELSLSESPRVHRFEEKAGFASVLDYYAVPTPHFDKALAIKSSEVIELTDRLNASGMLEWEVPGGRWRVLRLGYSLTGHVNGPASVEASGLEVDKLDAERVHAYMETYLDQFESVVGEDLIGEKGLQAVLSDSFEAGFGNWTDDILDQFSKRRGYSAIPFLPVLTGRVVNSSETSDAFLYDFRQTLADLLSEAHYGSVASVASSRGLKVYGEALESGMRPTLGDDMAMRRYTSIPMGAMWTFSQENYAKSEHLADLKGAASVANLYGKRYVAAESFSSMFQPWAHSPRQLKHVADTMLALGVNRFIVHSSVHQPLLDREPGLSLWIFGQYFNRNEAWAEQARPWLDYLTRSSWLLSQGHYGADVAYFYGEEAPLVTLSLLGKLLDTPKNRGFDYVNADALMSEFSVSSGELRSRLGRRYKALQLGGSSQYMTLPVLHKIHTLVRAGAVVVGDKPIGSPSLADDPVAFKQLADKLWAGGDETHIGKGRVIAGKSIDAALSEMGVPPAHEPLNSPNLPLLFHQRELNEGALWFVSNPSAESFEGEVAFRVSGFAPELWDAETGLSRSVSYRTENGRTFVPMVLNASDSTFVVFRKSTNKISAEVAAPSATLMAQIQGAWQVDFQPGLGAPADTVSLHTGSWAENENPGVRYFSGTAAYRKDINLNLRDVKGRVILDLGDVGDIAHVRINNRSVRTLWRPPYRVDISEAVVNGMNRLEIRVSNRWVNRMIGDAQENTEKVTWTVAPVYAPNAPLLRSGLLGPVRLLEEH